MRKVEEAEVRKVCRFADEVLLDPAEVLEHAEKIHEWIKERGGKDSVRGQRLLFAWASQELEVPLSEFSDGEDNCMGEGMCYGLLAGVVASLIFNIDMVQAIPYGLVAGMFIGMLMKKKG